MATKAQERKALEEIKKIIAGLGEDSYLAAAFDGCFYDAEQNIENDFMCSYKQRYEIAEHKADDAQILNKKLEGENKNLQDQLSRAIEVGSGNLKFKAEALDMARRLDDAQLEIVRLKAKLYDVLFGEEQKAS
jgi:hypothetical protein